MYRSFQQKQPAEWIPHQIISSNCTISKQHNFFSRSLQTNLKCVIRTAIEELRNFSSTNSKRWSERDSGSRKPDKHEICNYCHHLKQIINRFIIYFLFFLAEVICYHCLVVCFHSLCFSRLANSQHVSVSLVKRFRLDEALLCGVLVTSPQVKGWLTLVVSYSQK